MLHSPLGRVRLVGLLEGASFLVLLGIAMPLKYFAGLPEAVRVAGSVHGMLFVIYVGAVAHAAGALRWSPGKVLIVLFAAVVPFGPFVLDPRLRRETEEAGVDPHAATR